MKGIKASSRNSEYEGINYDTYCELLDEGYNEKIIRRNMNLTLRDIENIKDEVKDY